MEGFAKANLVGHRGVGHRIQRLKPAKLEHLTCLRGVGANVAAHKAIRPRESACFITADLRLSVGGCRQHLRHDKKLRCRPYKASEFWWKRRSGGSGLKIGRASCRERVWV